MSQAMNEAYAELCSANSTINWILFGFPDNGKVLDFLGDGGLDELKTKLDPKQLQFAAFKVVGVDEQANVVSRRNKFIGLTWIGTELPALKRGLVLKNRQVIDGVLHGLALSIEFNESECPPPELTAEYVASKLLGAGG